MWIVKSLSNFEENAEKLQLPSQIQIRAIIGGMLAMIGNLDELQPKYLTVAANLEEKAYLAVLANLRNKTLYVLLSTGGKASTS